MKMDKTAQYKKSSLFRHSYNRILHYFAMNLPGSSNVRPFLHKLRGVRIGDNVFIGDQVYIENEYPERVTICSNSEISIRTILIAHFRGRGEIKIGENVWIGPNCVIASSSGRILTIGDGAVIGAGSVVTSDVPPGIFVSSEHAKPVARVTVPWTKKIEYKHLLRGLAPIRKEKQRH